MNGNAEPPGEAAVAVDDERWRLVRLLATLVAGALSGLFAAMAATMTSGPVWLVFVVVVMPVWVLLVALLVAIWLYLRKPVVRPSAVDRSSRSS